MNEKPEKLIDKKGIRLDGRKADELRPVKLQVGVLSNADGSAYIEHGKNKILAAAFGPREMHPKHLSQPDKMVLRCRYHLSLIHISEPTRLGMISYAVFCLKKKKKNKNYK